jgi:hypothetical protein
MSARRTGAALAPYEALVRIAERQLELAGQGRYVELAQLSSQRDEVMRQLPRPAPEGAREVLERALAMQRRLSIELIRRREHVLLSLRRVEMSRRAASGYARSLPSKRSAQVLETA